MDILRKKDLKVGDFIINKRSSNAHPWKILFIDRYDISVIGNHLNLGHFYINNQELEYYVKIEERYLKYVI